jgi:hypothetical protein
MLGSNSKLINNSLVSGAYGDTAFLVRDKVAMARHRLIINTVIKKNLTNGYRRILRNRLQLSQPLHSNFRYTLGERAGRDRLGHISVRGRSSHSIYTRAKLISNLSVLPQCILTTFGSYDFFFNRIVMPIFGVSGLLGVLPVTSSMGVLSLSFSDFNFISVLGQLFDRKQFSPIVAIYSLVPAGSTICYASRFCGGSAVFARAAGACCTIFNSQYAGLRLLKLPSGKFSTVMLGGSALFGHISNEARPILSGNKAGISRNFGRRPITRGIVRNPVDHPNGGRARSLARPRSPWGVYSK